MSSEAGAHRLVRHIGLGHGVALYVSAILGAGVLVLPGQVATMIGPASLLSWAFACAMGVPLACMFAALARRHPDAGGIVTYITHAFGPTLGGVTGWMYFVAGSVGQTIVPLTGGYYVAQALHLGRAWAFMIAAAILCAAVSANLAGLRIGSRAQLGLAAGVAIALVVTVAVSVPHMALHRLTPFAPHGYAAAGAGVIVLFLRSLGGRRSRISSASSPIPITMCRGRCSRRSQSSRCCTWASRRPSCSLAPTAAAGSIT